ncbi:MAG: hypothetical protein AAE987_03740 [Thermoplasmataceae archaeon]
MKGSTIRKRYILMQADSENLKAVVNDIHRKFGTKLKWTDGNNAIVLTDQFQKDVICQYIQNKTSVSIITVSGTIKKCKSLLEIPKLQTG